MTPPLVLGDCDGLGEVTGAVDIQSFGHCEVVGEELEREDVHDRLQHGMHTWDIHLG